MEQQHRRCRRSDRHTVRTSSTGVSPVRDLESPRAQYSDMGSDDAEAGVVGVRGGGMQTSSAVDNTSPILVAPIGQAAEDEVLEFDDSYDRQQANRVKPHRMSVENSITTTTLRGQVYKVIRPNPIKGAQNSIGKDADRDASDVSRAAPSKQTLRRSQRESGNDQKVSELASLVNRLQSQVDALSTRLEQHLPEVIGKDIVPPWSHTLNLQPKDKVVIMGTFPDSGRLTINLCGSNSIPFSFDVRFSSVSRKSLELARAQKRGSIRAEPALEVNEVLVTSNPDSKIQEDNVAIVEPVILKQSPFEPLSDFTLEICCYWGSFVVIADGKFLLDYKYRVALSQVQSIYVLGSPGFVHSVEKKSI